VIFRHYFRYWEHSNGSNTNRPTGHKANTVGRSNTGLTGIPCGTAGDTGPRYATATKSVKVKGATTRIKSIDAEKIHRELNKGKIVLVAGFPGVDEKGNITRRFGPAKKPKQFDVQQLNDILFQATHTKDKKGKTVEIEPSTQDIIALRIAAEQSGFELRRIPKTFATVSKFGKAIPGTFTYRLVPKVKRPKGTSKKIDVKSLTDAQLDAIIGSK